MGSRKKKVSIKKLSANGQLMLRDRRKAAAKPELKFIPGEEFRSRHARRKEYADRKIPEAKEWCQRHGIFLYIADQGKHWRFIRQCILDGESQDDRTIEWCLRWQGLWLLRNSRTEFILTTGSKLNTKLE